MTAEKRARRRESLSSRGVFRVRANVCHRGNGVADLRLARVARAVERGSSVRMDDEPSLLELVSTLGPMTQREIAVVLGMSGERVRQIEVQGLTKIVATPRAWHRAEGHRFSLYRRLEKLMAKDWRTTEEICEVELITDALDAIEGGLAEANMMSQQRPPSLWERVEEDSMEGKW